MKMRGLDIVGSGGANEAKHGWWQTAIIVAAIFTAAALEIAYARKGKR